jgi:glycosyltransferase involved in cell wall biosynthesis
MTILFLNSAGTLGGAERSLLDLMSSLLRAEPAISLGLIVGGEGALASEAEQLGVKVSVLPFPERVAKTGDHALAGALAIARRTPALLAAGAEVPAYGLRLRREMRTFEPTLIHSNGLKTHLLSALVPLRGVPVVWHVHDFVGQRAVMAHVLRALAWRPRSFIAISRSVAGDITDALGRPGSTVVYNGIDTTAFVAEGERADLDALAGIEPAPLGVPRVGLIATYARG